MGRKLAKKRRTVLRLRDLDHSKSSILNSLSDHERAWLALPLFSSLGSIPQRTDGPGLFTTLDYGS
jgi:hypothetical protein